MILVSLGVIFLPDILSGKRSNHHDPIASIPLRPETAAALPVVSAATVTANSGAVSGAGVPEGVVVSNQTSAAAAEQWSVDEVAPTVTSGGDQAGQQQAFGSECHGDFLSKTSLSRTSASG